MTTEAIADPDIRGPVFDLLPLIFRDCVDPENHRYSVGLPFANGTILGQKYAWLLKQHDARVFLPIRRQTRTVTDPVRFTVAGDVEGFVMPLTPMRAKS